MINNFLKTLNSNSRSCIYQTSSWMHLTTHSPVGARSLNSPFHITQLVNKKCVSGAKTLISRPTVPLRVPCTSCRRQLFARGSTTAGPWRHSPAAPTAPPPCLTNPRTPPLASKDNYLQDTIHHCCWLTKSLCSNTFWSPCCKFKRIRCVRVIIVNVTQMLSNSVT